MPPDLATITERVVRARQAAAGSATSSALLAELDDVLTEGYAWALDGDAWSNREEQRLHEVISDASRPVRGAELRARTTRHVRFQRDLIALRRALGDLRHERDRLRSGAQLSA